MKAKVNIKYRDKNDGKVHEIGEEVTVNKARFAEINSKLPGCLTDASAGDKPEDGVPADGDESNDESGTPAEGDGKPEPAEGE